jgi:uncharacterized membrane protein HdeD (DUF308 family)
MAAYPKAQYNIARQNRTAARGGFIILGALLVVVGLVSLAFPLLAALSANIVAGVTLMAGGIATLVHVIRARRWRGFALQLALGLLYLGGGLIFILNPFAGLIALTLMLGAFFAADGAARVLIALRIRPDRAWGLFLASGLLSLLLGVLVLLGLPGGWSIAVLGIVVGLNMILTGVSFLCCTGGRHG